MSGMILLDANTIMTWGKAGGTQALNALTNNGNQVAITDSVQREITTGNHPETAAIASWLSQNESQITIIPTKTEADYQAGLIASKYDLGEISIGEVLSNNQSSVSPIDIHVFSDDSYFASNPVGVYDPPNEAVVSQGGTGSLINYLSSNGVIDQQQASDLTNQILSSGRSISDPDALGMSKVYDKASSLFGVGSGVVPLGGAVSTSHFAAVSWFG
jgi:hypothetical protein